MNYLNIALSVRTAQGHCAFCSADINANVVQHHPSFHILKKYNLYFFPQALGCVYDLKPKFHEAIVFIPFLLRCTIPNTGLFKKMTGANAGALSLCQMVRS